MTLTTMVLPISDQRCHEMADRPPSPAADRNVEIGDKEGVVQDDDRLAGVTMGATERSDDSDPFGLTPDDSLVEARTGRWLQVQSNR